MSTAWNTAPWGSNRESYCHLLINRASLINGCLSPAPPINSKGEQDLNDPTQSQFSMLWTHLPQHCWLEVLRPNIPISPSLDTFMAQWRWEVPFGIEGPSPCNVKCTALSQSLF